jgi:membrane protease subunit HflK
VSRVSHSRSVYASLIGLVVQLLAFLAVFVVAFYTAAEGRVFAYSLFMLSWLILGGVPIWLGMLLVFDQKRRAANEEADLEQLRREREAAGASTAIFENEGASLRVAGTRLEWMQRWLLPGIGLLTGLGLSGGGVFLIIRLQQIQTMLGKDARVINDWWKLSQDTAPVAIIVLSIVLLCTFLFSRYASGMGRVRDWQLLRAGGSYMLGSTIAIGLVTAGLGVFVYSGGDNLILDYILGWSIPAVMVLLGFEMLVNFVLDLYRPRIPDVEPRAAYDSRLLGLFAEPGGIASSIAEAINYQFGFEVSKTWFYQLVMRSAIPLAGLGALTLWGMTTIVIIDPQEHAIIERWGRQVHPEKPLGPGWHVKAPWPWDVVHKYNTGNVKEIYVGFQLYNTRLDKGIDPTAPVLWVQEEHFGKKHWEFMIPRPDEHDERTWAQTADVVDQPIVELTSLDESSSREAAPVNLVRMIFEIHYRISAEHLQAYTQSSGMAERVLLNVAWREANRFAATNDIHTLLSRGAADAEEREKFTAHLLERLNERAADLGLEVVYLGLQNVHPEKSVSDAFRDVVNAQAEKISKIREARGDENQILSNAAGRPDRARRLATAIERSGIYSSEAERAADVLSEVSPGVAEAFKQALAQRSPAFTNQARAAYEVQLHRERLERTRRDFELGIGFSRGDVLAAEESLTVAEREAAEAVQQLDKVLDGLAEEFSQAPHERLIAWGRAKMAADFWDDRLKEQLIGLQGEAAVALSEARAERWRRELEATAEVARLRLEREAFQSAPTVYRSRLLYQALSEAYSNSRKYVLAFDPETRDVHIRYQAEETTRPAGDLTEAFNAGK